MEAEPRNEYSVSIPLLLDFEESQQKFQDSTCHDQLSTGKTSFSKTCFNTLNSLSGVGILSVPYALSSGGWLSIMFLFAIAIAAFYTGLLIKRCMDAHPNITSYPDVGELAFGKKGRLVVSVFMNLELYLVATSFLILEGDNLQNLFPLEGFEIAGTSIGGKELFIILVGVIILPTALLNDMRVLSYISASGVLASFIILASVFCTAAFDGIGFQGKVTPINWRGIPNAISIYAFCYCAHPVFPTLYSSMSNQNKFSKVLVVSFVFCTFTYASMAVLGYLMFGSEVQSQITLNLPTAAISSKVAIYTTLVNPIAKYALMIAPIVNVIERKFPSSYNEGLTRFFLVRITLVISTVAVALCIPFFGNLMSLVGAFLSLTASIILPCLCYLQISGTYSHRKLGFEGVVILVILSVGIVVAVIGTYTSLAEIIDQL